jgi:hypothetical protein
MSDDDRSGDRDEVADAIRARQSLENDIDLSGEELVRPAFTSGERLGAPADFEQTEEDEALDDDDVENSGDR